MRWLGYLAAVVVIAGVYNPSFRFMSRFVFGHAATLDEFVKHLEARAGTR